MKYDSEILVKVSHKTVKTAWIEEASGQLSFSIDSLNKLEKEVNKKMDDYMGRIGKPYINKFCDPTTVNEVTCPFATLEQPIDSWYCKVTENPCPIFAQISLDDKDTFYKYCNVDEYKRLLETKQGKDPKSSRTEYGTQYLRGSIQDTITALVSIYVLIVPRTRSGETDTTFPGNSHISRTILMRIALKSP